jgi:hypothetical protein
MLSALTVEANQSAGFLHHYGLLYTGTQLTGLRRLSDPLDGTVSIVRLLKEIGRFPDVITLDRLVALARARKGELRDVRLAEIAKTFEPFANPATGLVDKQRVKANHRRFKLVAENGRTYATTLIAHRLETAVPISMTYNELDAAIDMAGLLLRRYTTLITGATVGHLEPYIPPTLPAPFRRPLFDTDYRFPDREILGEVCGFDDPPARQ